jgi:hypothetical protein
MFLLPCSQYLSKGIINMKVTDTKKSHALRVLKNDVRPILVRKERKLPQVSPKGFYLDGSLRVKLVASLAQEAKRLRITGDKISVTITAGDSGFLAAITLSGRRSRPHAETKGLTAEEAVNAALLLSRREKTASRRVQTRREIQAHEYEEEKSGRPKNGARINGMPANGIISDEVVGEQVVAQVNRDRISRNESGIRELRPFKRPKILGGQVFAR